MEIQELNAQLQEWAPIIKDDPLWYMRVMPTLTQIWKDNLDAPNKYELASALYGFFEEKLNRGEIFLASSGPDFDQWRKPIDTAVIHYTGGEADGGNTWQKLSVIGLLRQYATDFWKWDDIYGIPTKDTPIWSGHFRAGKPVFYAYHWLVRQDGSFERLLEDGYIGWQAGNGDINYRSIGIVLDGKFEDSTPPIETIGGVISILKNYLQIPSERIYGHREVNPKTVCPGNMFLEGWKEEILKGLKDG
jgi:hypothetical protein